MDCLDDVPSVIRRGRRVSTRPRDKGVIPGLEAGRGHSSNPTDARFRQFSRQPIAISDRPCATHERIRRAAVGLYPPGPVGLLVEAGLVRTADENRRKPRPIPDGEGRAETRSRSRRGRTEFNVSILISPVIRGMKGFRISLLKRRTAHGRFTAPTPRGT